MTKNTRHAILRCAGVVLLSAGALTLRAGTRIQVQATPDSAAAAQTAQSLNAMGFGPAEVRLEHGLHKVRTRSYASYAEVNFAKPALKGAGFADAFAVQDAGSAPPTAETIFGPLSLSETARRAEAARSAPARALLKQAYAALGNGDAGLAQETFERVSREYPSSPQCGEAELSLGCLMLRRNEPEGATLQRFLRIAAGGRPAAAPTRLAAMERCAALFHRAKDLDSAAAAYEAIERSADSRQARAHARMQQGAVALEKARNGRAAYADARQLCDSVLADYPDASRQTRATAALMALETHAYDNQPAEVLKRERAFRKEFADSEEALLANYWFARARLDTGDVVTARQMLREVSESGLGTRARFGNVDVAASARQLLHKAQRPAGGAK